MTVTDLRKNLYKIFDEIQKSGKPIEVSRKGERFLIQPLAPKKSKFDSLKKEGIIACNPDDLADVKAWDIDDWVEPKILDTQ